MKKLFLISLSILLLIGTAACSSNQRKAQKAVKEYLSRNLNDPDSYQSVEFSEVRAIFSKVEGSGEYKLLIAEAKDLSFDLNNRTLSDEEREELERKRDNVDKHIELCKKKFKPMLLRYEIDHTYRARNMMGGLILSKETFILDIKIKRVFDVLNDAPQYMFDE